MQTKPMTVRGPRKTRSNVATLLALAILPIAMAGCEHARSGAYVAGWTLVDPAERHPILVSREPANLNLRVARGSDGLTSSQRAQVLDFVSHSSVGDAGNSRFVISAPGGSANEGAAMAAAGEVHHLLLDVGYPETSIAMAAYPGGHGDSPVRISYMRYVADAPDCGQDWSENLAANYRNTPYPNLGCATQRNFAEMVKNPADLLGPRTMTPRDAKRRDATYDRYVNGAATGSAAEASTIAKVTGD
jgi:pilus assembly protein CpaD